MMWCTGMVCLALSMRIGGSADDSEGQWVYGIK